MVEWGANRAGRESGHTPSASGEFIRDLWDTDKPAAAQANRSRDEGIYEEMIFRERLYSIVMHHDPADPLFLTYCARVAHYPIQAPAEYQQRPHIAKIDVPHRLVYHAQVEFLDEQLGNLTGMFKDKDMWDQTLMVLTSGVCSLRPSACASSSCDRCRAECAIACCLDNGGYTKGLGPCTDGSDPVRGITCMSGEGGANNYPMRYVRPPCTLVLVPLLPVDMPDTVATFFCAAAGNTACSRAGFERTLSSAAASSLRRFVGPSCTGSCTLQTGGPRTVIWSVWIRRTRKQREQHGHCRRSIR